MENATKALTMAGGVLISIIIISLFMLMVNSLTSYQKTDIENKRVTQVVEFNQQFDGYNREDVRGNEIYSLISRVLDYNNRYSIYNEGSDQYAPITLNIKISEPTLFAKDR